MSAADNRDLPQWLRDASRARDEAKALDRYVAALSEEERVAYYYANPDYRADGSTCPAYVLHDAVQASAAHGREAADAVLRAYTTAELTRSLKAQTELLRPTAALRMMASITAVVRWGIVGVVLAAAGFVAGGPHLAAGALTLAGCCGTLGVLRALLAREATS